MLLNMVKIQFLTYIISSYEYIIDLKKLLLNVIQL